MLDPEDEQIIAQVVTKLAGPPTPSQQDRYASRSRGRYSWLDHEELLSEATIACMETDVRTKATSRGAFHERIKSRLIDSQKTERVWREERTASIELVDVGDDGTVFTSSETGDPIPYSPKDQTWRGVTPQSEWDDTWDEETAIPKARAERSRLLDTQASMTTDDFVAWADKRLGNAWAKKRDVRTLLYGSSAEQSQLWTKYARGKRVSGGKRLVIDGVPTSEADYQETLREEWEARYRSVFELRLPVFVDSDSQTG